jgi:hypothetical protein
MHHMQFGLIVRDAEIANVISSVVRRHHLIEGKTEKLCWNCVFLALQALPN